MATSRPRTKPSTPKLSEAARHLVLPQGIVSTAWPSVGATCRRLGATFDPWQDGAGTAILGKTKAGLFAADAVAMSIPRQVGKTYLVGWIAIGLCLVEPKTLAVWTAHHGATAADTFRDLKGICQQAKVQPFVRHVYDSGARMEIIFTNGSRILFGAREHGFGRGMKRVGILVFDEAQILTAKSADAMVPTTNRHPNPLIFYMGTPPRPTDPSEHFTLMRKEAIDGESVDTFYLEFSADEDADPLDREQWAKANPSYPQHTTARAMLRMKKNLKGVGAFEREALGIWDALGVLGVFTPGTWAKRATETPPDAPVSLGIAADFDQTMLHLGAVCNDGPPWHLGSVTKMRADTEVEAFAAEVKRIQNEHGIPACVVEKGPASFAIETLEAAGVELTKIKTDDFIQACADLRTFVETAEAEHGNYDELNAALDVAGWKKAGQRRVIAGIDGDIAPLAAVICALHGIGSDYDVMSSVY